MSQQLARTPGAKRAGDGEYVFDLNGVNHILGGPDYSTANGFAQALLFRYHRALE